MGHSLHDARQGLQTPSGMNKFPPFVILLITLKAIVLFMSSADEMYGPITTLQRDNHLVKHIL